jgi:hypothetical protein
MRLAAALLAVAVGFAGCKTVHVVSSPPGADVTVDGEPIGKTPCKFRAKTFVWLDYEVEVTKPGWKPYKEKVDIEYGPGCQWMALVCVLGIFTAPLALATPFFGDVDPGSIRCELEPDFSQTPPPQTGLPRRR